MARRRRTREAGPREPFTSKDWMAIGKGLNKLCNRWLWYTAIKPGIDSLPDDDVICYGLFPTEVWDTLDKAYEYCGQTCYSMDHIGPSYRWNMEWTDYYTRRLLPSKIEPAPLPPEVQDFIVSVKAERDKWDCVEYILNAIQRPGVSKAAAAWTFPPAVLLLKMGGKPDHELADLKRSPTISAIEGPLLPMLRDAISIVGRACLLPAVTEPLPTRPKGSLRITISLLESRRRMLPTDIYPWDTDKC